MPTDVLRFGVAVIDPPLEPRHRVAGQEVRDLALGIGRVPEADEARARHAEVNSHSGYRFFCWFGTV